MDSERAALIREQWQRFRYLATPILRQRGTFTVPVTMPVEPVLSECFAPPPVAFAALTFALEHGENNAGRRGVRVVCEGLELDREYARD
jgi:hypothetical protein